MAKPEVGGWLSQSKPLQWTSNRVNILIKKTTAGIGSSTQTPVTLHSRTKWVERLKDRLHAQQLWEFLGCSGLAQLAKWVAY